MAKKITLEYKGSFDAQGILNSLNEINKKASGLNLKDNFKKSIGNTVES